MSQQNLSELAKALIVALTPFANGVVTADEKSIAEAVETATTEVTKDDQAGWALCAAKDFYIPHNPEIHAQTKRINADGTWMKYKGLKPETFTKLEGQWIDQYGKDASEYNLVDGELVKIQAETTARPNGPAKPGTPVKPNGPAKPGTPVAPANDRKAAMQAIDALYKEHGVQYDAVVEQLFDGAESFESLTDEQCTIVLREAKAWSDWLVMIKQTITKTAEIDTRGDDILLGATNYYINEASTDGELSGVPRDALSALHDQVEAVFKEWDSYYKTLG